MCNHARACSTQRRFSGDWSLARRLALVAFVLDDPVHRLVRDLDTAKHLDFDVALLPGGVGVLVPEAALEHFLATPAHAADAPVLGERLAAACEEQIALCADLVVLAGDVAAGDVGKEDRELFPGDCALKRCSRRRLSEDGGEEVRMTML